MRQLITKLVTAWRQRCARQHKADLERMLSGLIDARHRLDDEIEHTAELLIVANHHLEHLNSPAKPHRPPSTQWNPT